MTHRGSYLGNKRNYGIKKLSKREEQVAVLIRDEKLDNEDIAKKLKLSTGYVKQLVDGIYGKLMIGDDINRDDLPDVLREKLSGTVAVEEPVVEVISEKQFISDVFPGLID